MGVGLAVATFLMALMQGVFCKTWDVTLPQSIMGISDTCVTVPCRFEIPNNEEANIVNCSNGGLWRKGGLTGSFVFTASTPHSNVLQGQIVGDLTKKNCTTVFYNFPKNYSDVFFFRLDCSNHVKFTFNKGVIINVQPELPPPQLTSVRQVSEGDQVRLQCSVPVPCTASPPSITWLPRDNSREEQTLIQQFLDISGVQSVLIAQLGKNQMIMKSTVTFTASAEHHNHSISCSVSYPLTTGGSSQPSATTQRLSVLSGNAAFTWTVDSKPDITLVDKGRTVKLDAPRLTVATLSTSVPVSEGRTVMFTCWSDANPPVSLYTWYRAESGELMKKGEGEMLFLRVSENDSGVYLCEAQSQRGSQRSRPVFLEVSATTGSSECVVAIPYIICGVVVVLYIMTVVVDVYKYQSISRRLKQIELKGEQTYADLRTCSITSDYDQLQSRQPKTTPSDDVPNYENPIALQANFRNQQPPKWK